MEKQYTIKEVAELIHKTEKVTRKYCRQDTIKGYRTAGGTWLVSESALMAYLTGETPKGTPTENEGGNQRESEEVRKAEDARKIAEAKAAEAEADSRTRGFQETAERQAQVIAEAIKEEKGILEEATKEYNRQATALKMMAERFETDNVKLRELDGMQKTRIEELEHLVILETAKQAKLQSDTDYYNEHLEQGKQQLIKIAKNIAPYHKGLADYLNRQVARLDNGYEQGMRIFTACSTNIVKVAEWFQDNSKAVKEYDASDVCDYLCKADERLKVLMGMIWEVTQSEAGVETDRLFKEPRNQPVMMFHGEQDNIFGRILAKLGK